MADDLRDIADDLRRRGGVVTNRLEGLFGVEGTLAGDAAFGEEIFSIDGMLLDVTSSIASPSASSTFKLVERWITTCSSCSGDAVIVGGVEMYASAIVADGSTKRLRGLQQPSSEIEGDDIGTGPAACIAAEMY